MELKVWVDGVLRVVCGLSEETSCQDVVIALAQAIGQTGRYVLVQKLRDSERQLLAHERPLESLEKLGHLGKEVQYILRRTGPVTSSGPAPPSRSASLQADDPETPTFNLQKHFRKPPRESADQRRGASSPAPAPPLPPKEEAFRHVLQQQAQLRSLEGQLDAVQQEVWVWEQLLQELVQLEDTIKRNWAELGQVELWEEELRAEEVQEEELHKELEELGLRLEQHEQHLVGCGQETRRLVQEVQLQRDAPRLSVVRDELDRRWSQADQLQTSLSLVEEELEAASSLLQEKHGELDELNKELRQCNLQQFILGQTGTPPTSDLKPQLHTHRDTVLASREAS